MLKRNRNQQFLIQPSQKRLKTQNQKQKIDIKSLCPEKSMTKNIEFRVPYKSFNHHLLLIDIKLSICNKYNKCKYWFKISLYLPENFQTDSQLMTFKTNKTSLIKIGLVIDHFLPDDGWEIRLNSFYNQIANNNLNLQQTEKSFFKGFARNVLCKVIHFITETFIINIDNSILTLEASGFIKKISQQQLNDFNQLSQQELLDFIQNHFQEDEFFQQQKQKYTKEMLINYIKAIKENQLLVQFYQKKLNMKKTNPNQKISLSVEMQTPLSEFLTIC